MQTAAIAAPSAAQKEVARLRTAIDGVDTRLVALLAERLGLARETAAAKQLAGAPPSDPGREAEVVRRAAAEARAQGLDAEVVRAIFWRIIELSHRGRGGEA